MNFHRVSDWHEASDCGRYTVAAARVDGKFLFCAHLVGKPSQALGCFEDAGIARQCCRDHASGINVTAETYLPTAEGSER